MIRPVAGCAVAACSVSPHECGRLLRLGLIALLLVVAGCQTLPAQKPVVPVDKKIDAALAESAGGANSTAVEIPPDVARALLPPVSYSIAQGEITPVERRFDVQANNAPAREVFVGLAEGTPYSVVVHPDVTGTMSLDLKNVTFMEALEILRSVHGYAYERDGNRVMILGQGMRTQIFAVNYLNFVRKGSSETTVMSSQLSAAGGSSGGSAAASGGAGNSGGVSVKTSTEATFWTELKQTLEALIGAEDGRKVVVNPQANLVIVRALPRELDLVKDYLGLTHATVNRQVVLEAKIVEVELNDGFQSGISWAKLSERANSRSTLAQTGGGTLINTGTNDVVKETEGLLGADGAMTVFPFGGIFSFSLSRGDDFGAFVELLKTQGKVQVLSSPRVSTVNNQKAVIKVGGDEFFITGISNSTETTGATTTNTPEVDLQAFFSGIALDVTPQIDDADNIILHIHPSVSEVSQSSKTFVLNDKNFSLPVAVSNIQESDNVVRAQSGQVIVIGGLMKEAQTEDEAKVPLLGDLPVLGNLFKQRKTSNVKRELVIMLKPTVVVNNDLWRKDVRETRKRVVDLVGAKQ